MFKVGDRVKVSGEWGGDSRNGIGVIEDVGGLNVHGVRLDNGRYIAAEVGNIFSITTPPSKITQNGYEYSLVGPVKPGWLVDGAWVVRKESGEIGQVRTGIRGETVFSPLSKAFRDNVSNILVVEHYRPFTNSDWKWACGLSIAERRFLFVVGNCLSI